MKSIISLLTICLLITACNADKEQADNPKTTSVVSGRLPKMTGPAGRVLISVNDSLWLNDLSEVFKPAFSKPAVGPFISAESILNYLQQDPREINQLGKKNRNILSIVYDASLNMTETEIVIKKDYISDGQLYMIIKDSDKNRLIQFFKDELPTYITVFNDIENERLTKKYTYTRHNAFDKIAQSRFGISIGIPTTANFVADLDSIIYALDKNSKEFADNPNTRAKGGIYWAKKGILIWESDYKDSTSMNPINLLIERDSTLKKNVKGTIAGSYMATEYYPTHQPKFTAIKVDGAKAIQIEGLWIHAGNDAASGGGPFVQYAIHHKSRGTIVHVSTYIFALNFKKRELLREVRAMLSTIKLVD